MTVRHVDRFKNTATQLALYWQLLQIFITKGMDGSKRLKKGLP